MTGHLWQGITHCPFLSGYRPNNDVKRSFLQYEMDEVFRNAFNVLAMGPIYRTDLHGTYIFAQLADPLLTDVHDALQ